MEKRHKFSLWYVLVGIWVFIGIWYFMMKRMTGQQPGFMTLGKNKATEIAGSMVREYGMSTKVGQVYFAREKRAPLYDHALGRGRGYSEATAQVIDQEVREIISQQYEKALVIVEKARPVMEKAALVLLEKEKIEGKELRAIMEEMAEGAPDSRP